MCSPCCSHHRGKALVLAMSRLGSQLPELPKSPEFSILAIVAIVNFGNLSLPLLVFRVLADHTHHAFAVHDLALVTNLFY